MSDLTWFHLVCFRDDDSDDGEVEGIVDFDDFQIVFDEAARQIRISLTGAQIEELKQIPSIMARAYKPLGERP